MEGPGLYVVRLMSARCIKEREEEGRPGRLRKTGRQWDGHSDTAQALPSKERTAHYHSGPAMPTGTDLAHSRHSGLNVSQMTLRTRVMFVPRISPLDIRD